MMRSAIVVAILVVCCAAPALTQTPDTAPSPTPSAARLRSVDWWVLGGFTRVAPAESERSIQSMGLMHGERATFAVSHPQPAGQGWHLGGGRFFTSIVGAGVTFTRHGAASHADLTLTVPHPRYNDLSATDNAKATDEQNFRESAIHAEFSFRLPLKTDRIAVRLFAGPSYIMAQWDAVTNVRYDQTVLLAPNGASIPAAWLPAANIVEITGTEQKRLSDGALGVNAGADVAYFVYRSIGVAGLVRVSRANATFDKERIVIPGPFPGKLGGVDLSLGVRFRF